MPNLNDFSPDERQAYLNWLQKKQAASEGVMSQASADMAGLEGQYAQAKPDVSAMQDAAQSDNFGGAAYRLMSALNSGMGNQGAAQAYGAAAKERPQSAMLDDKNKQFLDYLKGLSGMQAQRYGVAIPAAQKAEANATEALGNYDKLQATTEQRKQELAARADENAKNRDQRAEHDKVWAQVMAGNTADRRLQAEFNREMQKQNLEIRKSAAERDAEKDKRATDKFESSQQSTDPDYEVKPGYVISDPVEIRKSHDVYNSTLNLREAIPKLKSLMEKRKQGLKFTPDDLTTASNLATDIQLRLKGDDQYGLGVLAGPDMELLSKVVPQPGVINWEYLMQTGPARLDQTMANINRNYDSRMRSLGYVRKSGGGGKQQASAPGQESDAELKAAGLSDDDIALYRKAHAK